MFLEVPTKQILKRLAPVWLLNSTSRASRPMHSHLVNLRLFKRIKIERMADQLQHFEKRRRAQRVVREVSSDSKINGWAALESSPVGLKWRQPARS
jgi:DNA helicase TIP49 (TBP-interacting protein)